MRYSEVGAGGRVGVGGSASWWLAAPTSPAPDHITGSTSRFLATAIGLLVTGDQFAKRIEFIGSESSVLSDLESSELQGTEGGALEADHLVSYAGHHPSNFPITSLSQFELQERTFSSCLEFSGGVDLEVPVGELESLAELFEAVSIGDPGDLNAVDPGHLVARVNQLVGQFAIVGDHQQSFAVFVESSDAEQAGSDVGEQVDDPRSTSGVPVGAQVSCRLVQQVVLGPFGANGFSVDDDSLRRRIDSDSELIGSLSIDANSSSEDQCFAGSSRSDSGPGQYLLQADSC